MPILWWFSFQDFSNQEISSVSFLIICFLSLLCSCFYFKFLYIFIIAVFMTMFDNYIIFIIYVLLYLLIFFLIMDDIFLPNKKVFFYPGQYEFYWWMYGSCCFPLRMLSFVLIISKMYLQLSLIFSGLIYKFY